MPRHEFMMWLNLIAPFMGMAVLAWAFFQIYPAKEISETGFGDFYVFVAFLVLLIALFAMSAFMHMASNRK